MSYFDKKIAVMSLVVVIIIANIILCLNIFIVPYFLNISMDAIYNGSVKHYIINELQLIVNVLLFILIYHILIKRKEMEHLNKRIATIALVVEIVISGIFLCLMIILPDYFNFLENLNSYFGAYVLISNTLQIVSQVFLYLLILKIGKIIS